MKFRALPINHSHVNITIWALETKFGDFPRFGEFLNPGTGFWQNAESKNNSASEGLKLDGLQGKVTIKFDEHRNPLTFSLKTTTTCISSRDT